MTGTTSTDGLAVTTGPVERLAALADTAADVLARLEALAASTFGPAAELERAVDELRLHLAALDLISPRHTGVTVAELVDQAKDGPDAPLVNSLAAALRSSIRAIHERSAALSLELGRLLADTQDVVSSATGGAGIYDITGRTAVGPIRRERAIG